MLRRWSIAELVGANGEAHVIHCAITAGMGLEEARGFVLRVAFAGHLRFPGFEHHYTEGHRPYSITPGTAYFHN